MLKVSLDTSVIVELVNRHTDKHEITAACFDRHRAEGDQFIVAEHALLEAFSVLTRAPKPMKLPASVALELLAATLGSAINAGVGPGIAWEVIRTTTARGYAGGRVYDAVIAIASARAGADVMLTWNVGHFLSVAPAGLQVRPPTA